MSRLPAAGRPRCARERVRAVGRDRLPHGLHVLRRHVGLDVVDRGEDEAAARRKVGDAAPHLGPDLVRRPAAQHALRVHAAAPEDEVAPEVALEGGRLHAGRRDLDRVQDVDARSRPGRGAARGSPRRSGRGPSPGCAARMNAKSSRMERLHQLAVGPRGEERRGLAAQVVGLADHVHRVAQLGQDRAPPGELHLEHALHERRGPGPGRRRGPCSRPRTRGAGRASPSGRRRPSRRRRRGPRPRSRAAPRRRRRPDGRGRRRPARRSGRGGRRRSRRPAGADDGSKKKPSLGHPPPDAPLVEVARCTRPRRRSSRRYPDGPRGSTPRTSRPSASATSSSIDGELLGEVADAHLALRQPERAAQARVGADVDPGHPHRAHVARDAVGLAVVQRGANAGAGVHRVASARSRPRASAVPRRLDLEVDVERVAVGRVARFGGLERAPAQVDDDPPLDEERRARPAIPRRRASSADAASAASVARPRAGTKPAAAERLVERAGLEVGVHHDAGAPPVEGDRLEGDRHVVGEADADAGRPPARRRAAAGRGPRRAAPGAARARRSRERGTRPWRRISSEKLIRLFARRCDWRHRDEAAAPGLARDQPLLGEPLHRRCGRSSG